MQKRGSMGEQHVYEDTGIYSCSGNLRIRGTFGNG